MRPTACAPEPGGELAPRVRGLRVALGAADDLPLAGGAGADGDQQGHVLAGAAPAALEVDAVDEEVGGSRPRVGGSSRHVSTGRLLDARLAPAVALDHGGLEGRAAQLGDPELDLSAGRD